MTHFYRSIVLLLALSLLFCNCGGGGIFVGSDQNSSSPEVADDIPEEYLALTTVDTSSVVRIYIDADRQSRTITDATVNLAEIQFLVASEQGCANPSTVAFVGPYQFDVASGSIGPDAPQISLSDYHVCAVALRARSALKETSANLPSITYMSVSEIDQTTTHTAGYAPIDILLSANGEIQGTHPALHFDIGRIASSVNASGLTSDPKQAAEPNTDVLVEAAIGTEPIVESGEIR